MCKADVWCCPKMEKNRREEGEKQMAYKYLSIGEMAKINNISIPTLRFYDSVGLLHPCYTDPNTHYRYYDIRQNARLDMIQYMKELGMELREIQEVLASEDLRKIEAVLIKKREQTIAEIEEMSGVTYDSIHVVGGGANAAYLNELTAKATGKTVYAGPTEATAIGNLTAQIIAAGELANLQEARKCIFDSFEIKTYR